MNAVVALMILNISCADPALTFREFYARVHIGPYPGFHGERMDTVYDRLANTAGDYVEYRAMRAATCGAVK